MRRGARRSRGFSLLELLVVVAIIGIFTGIAVLSVGVVGDDREIKEEAFRLKSLLELVHEEALMQNRDFGVKFTETGYRFYGYDFEHDAWLEPAADNLLAAHELRDRLSLSLSVEDRDLVLEKPRQDAKAPKNGDQALDDPRPQVLILADGEMTPFQADISREADGPTVSLRAQLDGTLEISDDDEQAR